MNTYRGNRRGTGGESDNRREKKKKRKEKTVFSGQSIHKVGAVDPCCLDSGAGCAQLYFTRK